MSDILFRGETPPELTVTFDAAVVGYASTVLRFFEPRSAVSLLDATITLAEGGRSGTVALVDTDLADFTNQVYACLPIGIAADGDETALFETPVKFIIRTLPVAEGVS